MTPIGRYVRGYLHRRLFVWFGATIFVTGAAAFVSMSLIRPGDAPTWRSELDSVERFAVGRFARVWDDEAQRSELARAVADQLSASVVLADPNRHIFASYGGRCRNAWVDSPVTRDGQTLGYLRVCVERRWPVSPLKGLLPLFCALFVLWAATGKISRRITRPLAEVVRVAEEIGKGNLSARVVFPPRHRHHHHRHRHRGGLHPHHHPGHRHGHPNLHGEEAALAVAINDMAARIERQLADQRELLAAVSHELRTPLARIRILTELAREDGVATKPLDELDQEVVEMDALVGDLLASSRIEFGTLTVRPLDAGDVARRALERAGLPAEALSLETQETAFEGDATLLARALANLLENARKHAGGAKRLRVRRGEGRLFFEVEDAGGGFAAGDEEKVFRPFYRRPKAEDDAVSLGLGLALVKRIAEAHRGRAYAANRLEGGGAVVGLELPARPV